MPLLKDGCPGVCRYYLATATLQLLFANKAYAQHFYLGRLCRRAEKRVTVAVLGWGTQAESAWTDQHIVVRARHCGS